MPIRDVISLCLLVAALAAAPASAGATQARQADAFVDSIGVGVHFGYSDTPYVSQFTTVKQRLEELGVRHLRDDLTPDRPDHEARLEALAGAGIGSTLIMGSPAGGAASPGELLGVAADLDGVEALEGPNEYSTMGNDPGWVANLRAYQRQLYEGAKAEPALAGLPVLGPSIVAGHQDELGDLSAFLDRGNVHSYPQGGPPDKLRSTLERAALNSGTKPVWATETGYNNAVNADEPAHPPVPEEVAATYMPRLLFEYWRWGIERTFLYELLDEFPDPGRSEPESHFGLLHHDLSPKPAFTALHNTIAILADPGPAFAPGELDLTVRENGVVLEEPGSPLHKVLLQKRGGAFYLALWRTSRIWDETAGEPLASPAGPVEVSVEPGIESVSAYSPAAGTEPIWSASEPGETVSVEVGPAVTILRLSAKSATHPEPPGPEPPGPEAPGPQPPGPGPSRTESPSAQADAPPSPQPTACLVPKLRGRTAAGARVALRSRHCSLGAVRGPRERGSRVVRQWPRPGRILADGAPVTVKLRGDD